MRVAYLVLLGAASGCLATPSFSATSKFDQSAGYWLMTNGLLKAEFEFTADGYFRTVRLADLKSKDEWAALANRSSSVVRFQVDDTWFDAQMPFELVDEHAERTMPAGVRQVIVLRDVLSRAQVTVNLELYDGHSVLR